MFKEILVLARFVFPFCHYYQPLLVFFDTGRNCGGYEKRFGMGAWTLLTFKTTLIVVSKFW